MNKKWNLQKPIPNKTINLLRHAADKNGVQVDQEKVSTLKRTSRIKTRKKLCSFLDIARYYRRFINAFRPLSAPLRASASMKNTFTLTEGTETAFQSFGNALNSASLLGFPDFEAFSIIKTDVSTVAVGAVLSQKKEDQRTPRSIQQQ